MKRLIIIALLGGPACFSAKPTVSVFENHLVISRGSDTIVCDLETNDDFVGSPDFETPPECEVVEDMDLPNTWAATEKGALIFDYVTRDEDCHERVCGYLRLVDFDTAQRTTVYDSPRSFGHAFVTDRFVVWSDTTRDDSGLCFFPEGDEDCVVDIFAFDRFTGDVRRLTDGTVVPNRIDQSARHLGSSHRTLVYADRRRVTEADCYVANHLDESRDACRAELYVVDLLTGQERLLASGPRTMTFPTVDDGVVTWLETDDDGKRQIWTDDGTDEMARLVANVELFGVKTFDTESGWAVIGFQDEVELVSIATGERLHFDEVGGLAHADGGRVVWMDADAETLSIYEFETQNMRTMEVAR